MRLGLVLGTLLLASSVAHAVSLGGWWRAQATGEPPQLVQVTQAGDTVTISVTLSSFPGQLGGTISGVGEFDLTGTGYPCSFPAVQYASRLLPGATVLDGFYVCPSQYQGRLTLTRCTCHDGNTVNGDGCDVTCQVEPCFTCAGDPSVCTPTPDGGACDDRRDCTAGETCAAGACGAASPVVPCTDMSGLWSVVASNPFGSTPPAVAEVVQRDGIVTLAGVPTAFNGAQDLIGTIDRATGAFDVAFPSGLAHVVGCPRFSSQTGTAGASTFSSSGTEYDDHHLMCEGFELDVTGTRTPCGNGVLDPGEACDDGNNASGDGCDLACAIEPCFACSGQPSACVRDVGASCDDGNSCTTGDVCTISTCAGVVVADGTGCTDGQSCTTGDACVAGACVGSAVTCPTCESCDPSSGACAAAPRATCLASTAPTRTVLKLRNATPDTKDSISWTWANGAATTLGDLGDPVTTDRYALCVFGGTTPAPALLAAIAPAGGTCAGKPCWTAKATKGFVYKDKDATPSGLTNVVLQPGVAGKAKVKVKGKGPLLASGDGVGFPSLPLPLPLRLQLQGENGACFEARYDGSGVQVNDAASGKFKARAVP
jgi:cysteine-rich repeat protein